MKKVALLFVLIAWLVTACSPVTDLIPSTNSLPISPTEILHPTLIFQPTLSQLQITPVSTQILGPASGVDSVNSTQEPKIPKFNRICPEQTEVTIKDFAINPRLRLIVKMPEKSQDTFMVISGNDTTPHPIPNVNFENGWRYWLKSISPDGKWLIYSQGKNSEETAIFLLVSVDGKQKYQLPLTYKRTNISWLSDNEAIVSAKKQEEADEIVMTLSPFTQQVQELGPAPSVETSQDILATFFHDNVPYSIYYDWQSRNDQGGDTGSFILRNYATGELKLALPWLNIKDVINQGNERFSLKIKVSQYGEISIIVPRSYGFDIATGLWPEITDKNRTYEDLMHPIVWPRQENLAFLYSVEEKGRVFNLIENISKEKVESFALFDYHEINTITEYCIAAQASDALVVPQISPDHKYFAWELHNMSNGSVIAIIVFDRTTGKFARITGLGLFGWAQVGE